MEKSLAQSTVSKNITVSSSSESEDDCDNKCNKNPENIKSAHFNKIEKWIISQVLYPMVLSHSVWSAIKFWGKIRRPALKGIICQNMQQVLKKDFRNLTKL